VQEVEQRFETELEAFRVDGESAAQFFYAFQTIHYRASSDASLTRLLDRTPMYWNTSLGALREAAFTSLGRVFDSDGRTHNIHRLLKIGQQHNEIFTAAALEARKRTASANASDWIDEFMSDIHEPTAEDWRRLRKHVAKWENVYRRNYRDIRHKVYAHRQRITELETQQLFAKTSYDELEQLFGFLDALYEALWRLYHNGQKPHIKYKRRSLLEMLSQKRQTSRGAAAGELIAADTDQFLRTYMRRS